MHHPVRAAEGTPYVRTHNAVVERILKDHAFATHIGLSIENNAQTVTVKPKTKAMVRGKTQ